MSLKNSNSLLLALPRAELDWLEAKFSPISLSARDQLYEQGELMSRVFFPTSAVISLASVVEEGGIAEVATVGNEGVLGVPIFLGIDLAVARSTVTVAGDALVMPAETFKEALSMSEALRRHVARYLYALLLQITRSGGCSAHHSLEQRCAGWLLVMLDRAQANDFPLPQEVLADALAASRPRVNKVLGAFQRTGLLTLGRARVAIVNRKKLEQKACECYRSIRNDLAEPP